MYAIVLYKIIIVILFAILIITIAKLKKFKNLYREESAKAITDPLTRLYNRRYLEQRLREEISRAERLNYPLQILFIDLDGFKKINDTKGHDAGDELLKKTAGILAKSLRDYDILSRFGGDEFVLILPHTDSDSAKKVSERLLKNLENIITASIGICEFDYKNPVTDPIKAADEAMYQAKKSGKNKIHIYTK